MSVLGRKLRRDLWQSKGMIAAVTAIITVGISCLIGFQGTWRNLEAARVSYYADCRMADFWIDLKKVPVSVIPSLAGTPGVAEIRDRIGVPLIVDLEDVPRPVGGLILSLPDRAQPVINDVIIRSGNYFSPDRRNEVIVTEAFAQAHHLEAGDVIHVNVNRRREELIVIGTAISSEWVYTTPPGSIAPEPADYGIFYVKRSFAAELMDMEGGANSLVGRLTPEAREYPQPVLDHLERNFKPYGVAAATPLDRQSSNLTLSSELSGLSTMAGFFPVVFLSVAALVLNVLMTRLVEQQRTIVGTLKALGYRRGELFSHFLQVALVVGLLGAVFGGLLGYLISGGMNIMYREFFAFPRIVNQIHPDLMILGGAVALVFSVLGTARGVRSVVRLRPAEAMRHRAPPPGRRILLENWPWFWQRLGFRTQMVLRGIFRHKARSLAALFAAAMGASLMVSTFGSIDSIRYMISFQFDLTMTSDYVLTFRGERDYGAVYEALAIPGVIRAEPLLAVPCTFHHGRQTKKGAILGLIPGATMTVPRNEQGSSVPVPPAGLLMTRRLADFLKARPGDTLTIEPARGEQRPVEVVLADTIDSLIGLAVYADYDYLNRLVGESAAVSQVQLKARQTPDQHREFLKELKRLPELEGYRETARQKEILSQLFEENLGTMVYTMILFGGVIFLGSMLNSSLIALVERKREIATFRVLGYHPREIGWIFLIENLVLNLFGTILGMPLGWILLKAMTVEFANDLYAMPSIIRGMSWLYCLALAAGFVLISQLVIQRSIVRLDWDEALKMKE